jgi:hypothetical protein
MVHLRDGGERIGVNDCTFIVNPEMGTFTFFNREGETEFVFAVEAIKMITRKNYPSGKPKDATDAH